MALLGFGETLLRLTPPDAGALSSARLLEAHVGGCESNVLATLSGMGVPCRLLTALPDSELGDLALHALRASGLDCGHIARLPRRLGVYFCESGFGQRASQVIYDRADAAINHLRAERLDLAALFRGQSWLYLSGITLGLSESARALAFALAEEAKARGVKLAFDVNYRARLWDYAAARPILRDMADRADLLFAGAADLSGLYGLPAAQSSDELIGHWRALAGQGKPRAFAATRRQVLHHHHHRLQGCVLLADGSAGVAAERDLRVLERIGGGDAFAAGVSYGLLQGLDARACADFGTACSALKHTLPGDFALMRPERIRQFAGEAASAIQR